MLINAVPVLPAADIADTLAFYRQKLGFHVRHQEEEYGIIVRDTVEVHFWRCGDRRIAENSSCRITVQGIEALFDHASKHGIVHPNAPLEAKPYGVREFAITDVNGNLIWFVERIAATSV
ncbi:MAG: bleomycin binding protein [Candidatus Roseilinea sp.]|nr:MAG: bleomycin binding protein [Candidatus Roseilinea sp.]